VHSLIGRLYGQAIPQPADKRRHQCIALLAIEHAHAPDMAGKMAFLHEFGDDGLRQGRWLPVH